MLTHAAELKEFGADRIGLIPFKNTETHGRKEFFIQGGAEAGSGYGIDLTDKMKGFLDEFVRNGKDLVLVVRGKSETKTEKSAVFTDWKQGFGRNIEGQNKYNSHIEEIAVKELFLMRTKMLAKQRQSGLMLLRAKIHQNLVYGLQYQKAGAKLINKLK